MLIVETIARIRREHFVKGKTIKEIATGHSWTQLRVRNFRGAHQIAVYRDGERA
jgi:hypothetical protein